MSESGSTGSTASSTDALALAAAVGEVTARGRAQAAFRSAMEVLEDQECPLGLVQRLMLIAVLDDVVTGLAAETLLESWLISQVVAEPGDFDLDDLDDLDGNEGEGRIDHDLFDMYSGAGHSLRVNGTTNSKERASA